MPSQACELIEGLSGHRVCLLPASCAGRIPRNAGAPCGAGDGNRTRMTSLEGLDAVPAIMSLTCAFASWPVALRTCMEGAWKEAGAGPPAGGTGRRGERAGRVGRSDWSGHGSAAWRAPALGIDRAAALGQVPGAGAGSPWPIRRGPDDVYLAGRRVGVGGRPTGGHGARSLARTASGSRERGQPRGPVGRKASGRQGIHA